MTGSREWSDVHALRAVLDGLLAEHGALEVVHGACPRGADAIADQWVTDQQQAGADVVVERHPADWGRHGRAAGLRRNTEMVAAGADLVVAFMQPGAANRGTAHCMQAARRAGIPVRRYPQPTEVLW